MLKIPRDSEREEKKMPAGGYVCRIVKASADVNRYDEPCLLIYLDVAEGNFKNYFGNIYKRRLEHGDNKYPCVYSQSLSRFSKRYFDRILSAVKASNEGYVCTCRDGEYWDEHELENLLVGVVFQEKEFTNSRGKTRTNLVPYEFKSVGEMQ